MMRSVLSYFSVLAFAVITAATAFAMLPWASGYAPPSIQDFTRGLQFESLLLGLFIGLTLGILGRFHWADVPRRLVTWFLVRERQFFYYSLVAICGAVLLLY